MSREPADDAPTTRAEFEAAVRALVVAAHGNGVTVENGIDVKSGGDAPNWGIEITRLRDDGTE